MYRLRGRDLSDIPVIETKRLRLRAAKIEDFPPARALWQNDVFLPHVGGTPRSARQVWMTLQSNLGSWGMLGYGFLTIADPKTDAFMGECGFFLGQRDDVTPAMPLIPEAGWGIAPEHWGKGYVSEAMHALMGWAFEQDPDFPCLCIINPGHTPSEKIAMTLGFEKSHEVNFSDSAINVWELNNKR